MRIAAAYACTPRVATILLRGDGALRATPTEHRSCEPTSPQHMRFCCKSNISYNTHGDDNQNQNFHDAHVSVICHLSSHLKIYSMPLVHVLGGRRFELWQHDRLTKHRHQVHSPRQQGAPPFDRCSVTKQAHGLGIGLRWS